MIDVGPFIQLGNTELDSYLSGIPGFLASLDTPGGLESTPLRAKPIDQYLRNILAVGVLNRIMRTAFLQTERKIIVLPDCLKNYGDWDCCKADNGNESVCTQCTPECLVYETIERFANSHTAIVLEPEDMDAFFAGAVKDNGSVGVVGMACALTMLSGFSKTIKHRMPTQGVFLNYSSCAHHWAHPAYNTCYSLRRMAWVISNRESSTPDETSGRGETYSLEKPPLSPDDFYRRLDKLANIFDRDYLDRFQADHIHGDLFDLCRQVQNSIVPDLITRDSA